MLTLPTRRALAPAGSPSERGFRIGPYDIDCVFYYRAHQVMEEVRVWHLLRGGYEVRRVAFGRAERL